MHHGIRVTKTFYMTYMLQVLSGEDGDEVVGRIRKAWGGEAKERYTDAEKFEVHCQYKCKHYESKLTNCFHMYSS